MDATEQIQRFATFLEENYYADLLEKRRKGDQFLTVEFTKLSAHDPELADLLLEQPEETLKAGEIAAQNITDNPKPFAIRVRNLPESSRVLIRNIRSEHLNTFLSTEAV